MNLRPYQNEFLKAITDNFYQGITCQGGSGPCGMGKAVIAAKLPDALSNIPGESLFAIAHRHELIDQLAKKFKQYNPGLTVEIERANDRACPDSDVVVGSLQSLTDSRIKKFDPERFRIIAIDECHHSFQSSHYQRIMEYFGVHRSKSTLSRQKLLVGFSATWRRGDNHGAEHLFDKIVFHRSMLDIMRSGIHVNGVWCPYLAPIRCDRELTELNLDKVKVSRMTKDYDTGDLSKAVNTPERNSSIVDAYLEHGEGLPAIAFTTDIQHSQDLAKAFCDRGIPFAAVTGDIKRNWRDGGSMVRGDILEDYRKGILRGVASCDALSEGTDLPWAVVGLNASPCLSPVKYQQKFGRITRPFPAPEERLAAFEAGRNPGWIKPYGIWIDFTDSSSKHNLCQAPTLFGLRPDFKFQGKDVEETVKAIEEAKEKCPTLDTTTLRSLDDLTRSSVAFSSTEGSRAAIDLRKWSSYPWVVESEGQWALPIKGSNTVLRVRQNDAKEFGVWAFHLGAGSQKSQAATLRLALKSAEMLLGKKDRTLLRRDAPWRRDPPTPPQAISLYMKDTELRKNFRNGDAYFTHCLHEYEAGDMSASKGALADLLSVHQQANRFMGPQNTARKMNWVQKAAAGVRQRFKSK